MLIPPLCTDCQHHALLQPPPLFKSKHQCTRVELRNPVDGDSADCSVARGNKHAPDLLTCGPSGTLFVEHLRDGVDRS